MAPPLKQLPLDPFLLVGECKIVVPSKQAVELSVRQAVKVAVDYSNKTGVETGFFYDVDTQKATSPIVSGDECSIDLSSAARGYVEPWAGTFHTHPYEHNETLPCAITPPDYFLQTNDAILELMVACPSTNDLLISPSISSMHGRTRSSLLGILHALDRSYRRAVPQQKRPYQTVEEILAKMQEVMRIIGVRRVPLDQYLQGSAK